MQPMSPAPWFRRPWHPPLTHIPIGAVVITAVLDVISLAGGAGHPWARDMFRGGTFTLMAGTAATPPAVLALSLVTVAVITAGGELGGRLVFRGGVGVTVAPPAGQAQRSAPSAEGRQVG